MSVYRDEKRGTWTVSVHYRDYENEVHQKASKDFELSEKLLNGNGILCF